MNRYKSYRDSEVEWIDEIPTHWIKSKFKYESSKLVQYGLNTNSEQYVEKGVRFLRTTDINDFGVISKDGVYIDEDNISQNYILEKFDFLISRSGTLGRSYLHLSDDLFSFAGYLVRFNFENLTKSKFVFYFTKSKNFFDWISLNTIQSTIGNVNGEKYSNLDIIIPPIHEQEQIVAYLDKKTAIVDTLIASKEEKINLLKENRTALINHAITKGLDPNVKLKDSGVEWIGEIPEHWVMKKIKYCLKHISQKETTSKNDIKISPENVESDTGICFNYHSDYEGEGMKFSNGDILLNKLRIYLKKIVLTDCEGYSMGEMIVLRTVNGFNKYFYYTLFNQLLINFWNTQANGVKLPRVSPEIILNTFTVFPPIEEQKNIVQFIDNHKNEIDELISLEQKKIETLKEYRQALISEVVTGKIKVVK
jgi:type I restriction enzyme S subunit